MQNPNIKIVKYETALDKPAETVADIAQWLGCPVNANQLPDFSKLPVMGSSELGRDEDGKFTYKSVPAPEGFNPKGRWEAWPASVRRQFKMIANEPLVYFGYENDDRW